MVVFPLTVPIRLLRVSQGVSGYVDSVEDDQPRTAQTHSPGPSVQYRLLRETGRGAMSVVWEAVDTRSGRRVAIKTLVAPVAAEGGDRAAWAARMEREARAVARLSHPNIVTTYEVGREAEQPYLVMEFLTGQTLRQRLRAGPLPPGEAAHVLDQAAAALDAVHAAGVLHRDLKPAGFMLLPGGTVKMMDFGLARQSDDTLVTQADMMVGSPSYMAPEHIHGDPAGPAGDLWSLGVILYEMLAGRPPFGGDRIAAVLEQVTTADPPPLPQLPPPVQAVLRRALAKDPAKRYPTAAALAADFRAARASAVDPGTGPADAPVSPPLLPADATPTRQKLPHSLPRVLIALAVLLLLGLLILAFR